MLANDFFVKKARNKSSQPQCGITAIEGGDELTHIPLRQEFVIGLIVIH
jgi:hypothetical protein